jgi:hypothetical protein
MKVFYLLEKVMTPSGLWDNGLMKQTSRIVKFPDKLFEEKAVIEEIVVPGYNGTCLRITIDGNSWIVEDSKDV